MNLEEKKNQILKNFKEKKPAKKAGFSISEYEKRELARCINYQIKNVNDLQDQESIIKTKKSEKTFLS